MPPPPPTSSAEPPGADSGSAGGEVLPLVPGLGRRPAKRRPLPDAAAVRLLLVPDSAPPYDDALTEAGSGRRPGQARPRRPAPPGSASPPRSAPSRLPAPPGSASPPRSAPTAPGKSPGPSGPRVPDRRPAAAATWPSQFAQVLAETLAGSRPQGQIRPWTSDQARRRIRQLGPRLAADVQPRVRRIMTSRPAAGVVEMAVIVGFGPRIRALAVRLERDDPHPADPGPYRSPVPTPSSPRWICTAIEAA
jgi:hypothetical protein